MKTAAATRFIDAIRVSWDSRSPYEATAKNGLSDVDADALRDICDETGESYEDAEAEVMDSIRRRVNS